MSLYGLNRATLNGGVSGIVAGAALVMAVSGFAADGTRWVLPTATVTSVSAVQADARLALRGGASITQSGVLTATGVRGVFGQAGFVTESTGSAFPALLQLVTANISVTSGIKATYTNAWALSTCQLQANGFITRPGASVAQSIWVTTLDPLVIAGFASNINITSSCSADASVKLSGQTTWQRDGYAHAATASALTAHGLKTALGYAFAETTSSCTAASIKTHGGSARFDSVWETSVVASTDAAWIVATSDMTAFAVATRHSDALMQGDSSVSAEPMLTTFAEPLVLFGVSDVTADARLALLADAALTGLLSVTADARLAWQGEAQITSSSSTAAFGEIYKMGEAASHGAASMTAQWALLIASSADITATSSLTAVPYTNAEAADPDARTMIRPFVARDMRRSFNDRTMRRTA